MSPIIRLHTARDPTLRDATPQCYASEAGLLPAHPLLAEAIAAAERRWGGAVLADVQVVDAKPGMWIATPVWRPAPATALGECLVGCLADEALLEAGAADGSQPIAGDELAAVASGTPLRVRAASVAQTAVVLMLRPAAGLAPLNRQRQSARVFLARPLPDAQPPAWADDRSLGFLSVFATHAAIPAFGEADIAAEPSLSGASPEFVRRSGGPIARAFLDLLPRRWREDGDVVVGVKRDELSPGWSSCLVGWHIDGTSRAAKRADGTPDLRNPGRRAMQFAACVGRTAATALLSGPLALPEAPLGAEPGRLGRVWQRIILDRIAAGQVEAGQAPCDRIFAFGWGAFHTCSPSHRPGWRCFVKAMRGRGDAPANRLVQRNTVAWPAEGPEWPDDALGVFPASLPAGA